MVVKLLYYSLVHLTMYIFTTPFSVLLDGGTILVKYDNFDWRNQNLGLEFWGMNSMELFYQVTVNT